MPASRWLGLALMCVSILSPRHALLRRYHCNGHLPRCEQVRGEAAPHHPQSRERGAHPLCTPGLAKFTVACPLSAPLHPAPASQLSLCCPPMRSCWTPCSAPPSPSTCMRPSRCRWPSRWARAVVVVGGCDPRWSLGAANAPQAAAYAWNIAAPPAAAQPWSDAKLVPGNTTTLRLC